MPANYVSLVVKADDGARPDLTALKAQLDELKGKAATAEVSVDDKAAVASLTALRAKLDGIGKRVEGKVSLEGATRMEAQLAAIDLGLDRLKDKAGDSGAGGVLRRILVPNFSNLGTAVGNATGFLGKAGAALSNLGALGPAGIAAIGGIAVVAAQAVTALTPLIASLGLVAAGIGGFFYLAAPEISKVFGAITATGAAAKTALQGLSPAERQLVRETEPLRDQFAKLQKAIQPYVINAFASGIKILNALFPAFEPLVKAAGKALDVLAQNIAKWVSSPSGQKFIRWMEVDGPRAIATFGRVAWDVIRGVGRTFDFLYNSGERFIHNWEQILHFAAGRMDYFRENVISAGHAVEHAFDVVRSFVASALNAVGARLEQSVQTAAHWVSSVISFGGRLISWFAALPGRIAGFLGRLPGILFSLGAAAINGLWNGLKSAAGGILSWVSGLASSISHAFSSVLHILSPSRVFEQHGRNIMLGLLSGLRAGKGPVLAEMGNLAGSLAGGRYGASGGISAATAGGGVIQLRIVGGQGAFDQFMATWLRNFVRVQGGDQAMFQRKVQFR